MYTLTTNAVIDIENDDGIVIGRTRVALLANDEEKE